MDTTRLYIALKCLLTTAMLENINASPIPIARPFAISDSEYSVKAIIPSSSKPAINASNLSGRREKQLVKYLHLIYCIPCQYKAY